MCGTKYDNKLLRRTFNDVSKQEKTYWALNKFVIKRMWSKTREELIYARVFICYHIGHYVLRNLVIKLVVFLLQYYKTSC
jgi:hypothetical protein